MGLSGRGKGDLGLGSAVTPRQCKKILLLLQHHSPPRRICGFTLVLQTQKLIVLRTQFQLRKPCQGCK